MNSISTVDAIRANTREMSEDRIVNVIQYLVRDNKIQTQDFKMSLKNFENSNGVFCGNMLCQYLSRVRALDKQIFKQMKLTSNVHMINCMCELLQEKIAYTADIYVMHLRLLHAKTLELQQCYEDYSKLDRAMIQRDMTNTKADPKTTDVTKELTQIKKIRREYRICINNMEVVILGGWACGVVMPYRESI